jgi:hypothetical protein
MGDSECLVGHESWRMSTMREATAHCVEAERAAPECNMHALSSLGIFIIERYPKGSERRVCSDAESLSRLSDSALENTLLSEPLAYRSMTNIPRPLTACMFNWSAMRLSARICAVASLMVPHATSEP